MRNRNKITTEIVLEGTREEVWKILVDLEKYPAWNPFIIRSAGVVRLNETLENIMMSGGKPMTFRPVITDLIEKQRFEWLGKAFLGGFQGRL